GTQRYQGPAAVGRRATAPAAGHTAPLVAAGGSHRTAAARLLGVSPWLLGREAARRWAVGLLRLLPPLLRIVPAGPVRAAHALPPVSLCSHSARSNHRLW
ncbi:hypothetical protein, partial [Kibdelosporangium philippinense]|uniref:hypothetical protein n=1 Tax=Kibdelosporangium philippinense TaxID=211113 RepID=UPI003609CE10